MKVTIGKEYARARKDAGESQEGQIHPQQRSPPMEAPSTSISASVYSIDGDESTFSSYSSSGTTTTASSITHIQIEKKSPQLHPLILTEITHMSTKNQKIVVINLRHYLVLFWILLFANAVLILSYLAIGGRMLFSKSDLFSISTIKTFLLTSTIVSSALSFGHIVVTHFKVEKMHSNIWYLMYQVSCVVLLFHYISMLLAAVVQLPLSTTRLKTMMKKMLDDSDIDTVAKQFSVTQSHRQCCGIKGYKDWLDGGKEEELSNITFSIKSNFLYPTSCCAEIKEDEETETTTCVGDRIWSTGCYDMESGWISFYIGFYIGILLIGLVINICLFFQERRLYRYCKIYRPHWVRGTKKKEPKSDEKTETEDSK